MASLLNLDDFQQGRVPLKFEPIRSPSGCQASETSDASGSGLMRSRLDHVASQPRESPSHGQHVDNDAYYRSCAHQYDRHYEAEGNRQYDDDEQEICGMRSLAEIVQTSKRLQNALNFVNSKNSYSDGVREVAKRLMAQENDVQCMLDDKFWKMIINFRHNARQGPVPHDIFIDVMTDVFRYVLGTRMTRRQINAVIQLQTIKRLLYAYDYHYGRRQPDRQPHRQPHRQSDRQSDADNRFHPY